MGSDESADTGAEVKPDIAGDQTQQTSHITLQFTSQERDTVPTKVKRSTPFEKMFVAYRSRFHLAEQDIRIVVNGTRVKPFQTPQEHEMEDGDAVEAIFEMVGGSKRC